MGLLPQASEARKRLRARQVAAAEVLQAASVAGSAAEVAEASARALSLGLADSVGLAEAELSRRRRAAAAELVRAAKLGKAEEYEVAAGEAARLGVEMAARAEACEGFGGRRAAALEALRAAATEGTLEEFASASKVALNLGASDDVNKASKAVAARRWEALRSLKNVTRAMLGRKLPAAPQDMASCRLLEVPTAQCPLGASCSGASEPSPANREAWMQLESWADLLASETCPEDLKSPVSEVLRICDGMGLGPWVRAAWAVVRAASAAAHAAGRGSVAVLQMPVDYWGNAHGKKP